MAAFGGDNIFGRGFAPHIPGVDGKAGAEKNALDRHFEKQLGQDKFDALMARVAADKKYDCGAHVVPIVEVQFKGSDGALYSWDMVLPQLTFEKVARTTVGRRLNIEDFQRGIWESLLSKDGQMGVERPLPCLLNQPLDISGFKALRNMVKKNRQGDADKFNHSIVIYKFPQPVLIETLLEDIQTAQNQFAIVKQLDLWFEKAYALIDKKDFKKTYDPANLREQAAYLSGKDIQEAFAITGRVIETSLFLPYSKQYLDFVSRLQETLRLNPTQKAIQKLHSEYREKFTKVGLQSNNKEQGPKDGAPYSDAELDVNLAHFVPRHQFERLERLAKLDLLANYKLQYEMGIEVDPNALDRDTKWTLLNWNAKGFKNESDSLTDAIRDGLGIIEPTLIYSYDILFNRFAELEAINRGNPEYKCHKDPREKPMLAVLILNNKGEYQLRQIEVHGPSVGDLYRLWKESPELQQTFKPNTPYKKAYVDKLNQLLRAQGGIQDKPRVEDIRQVARCISSFSKPILVEEQKQDEEARLAFENLNNILKRAEELAREKGLPFAANDRLSVFFEAGFINSQSLNDLATDDAYSFELSSGNWLLGPHGHSFASSAVDSLSRGAAIFENPFNRAEIIKAELIPNYIIKAVFDKVSDEANRIFVAGAGKWPNGLLEQTIAKAVSDHCKHDLDLFYKADNKPASGWAITLRTPIQGFERGNTYSMLHIARTLYPFTVDKEAVEAFMRDQKNNYYHNLKFEAFLEENAAFLKNFKYVAGQAPAPADFLPGYGAHMAMGPGFGFGGPGFGFGGPAAGPAHAGHAHAGHAHAGSDLYDLAPGSSLNRERFR